MIYKTIQSDLGPLLLGGDGEQLQVIRFANEDQTPAQNWQRDDDAFAVAHQQLLEYLDGKRRAFDLPLAPQATPFQAKVLAALQRIPYGETRSYRDIADAIGKPRAVRAVGGANGRNPLPIVIPCHRVIGADGSLTGFGGGLAIKRHLLELERSVMEDDLLGRAAG